MVLPVPPMVRHELIGRCKGSIIYTYCSLCVVCMVVSVAQSLPCDEHNCDYAASKLLWLLLMRRVYTIPICLFFLCAGCIHQRSTRV